ncbi:dihydrodipicolinate synthase family protein [Paenibacillus sp. 1P07SE]|uniref:dihydrodipicolinate synthase family protein n=1 Tax=Paenibacillus sp. 1P07SE TaxID=3132209 RepID=UPI0039A6F535
MRQPGSDMEGIIVPLFTQFTEQDEVDLAAMEAHTEYLIGAGVDAVFVGGSAAEFIALDTEERETAAERIIRKVGDRLPVLVHVTAANLRDSLRLTDHAAALGADALVAVSPWFWKHDDESLAAFFGTIAERAGGTPLYLYHMPHTGNDLHPRLVEELVRRHPNIVGLKNSQDDMQRTMAYAAMPQTAFFTGSDLTALYALSHGADGIISGLINVVPELFVSMKRSLSAGDAAAALALQLQLHQYARLFAGDMRRLKAGGEALGLGSRRCRAPLGTLTDEQYARFEQEISRLRADQASA